ncbi:hypothetical protein GCM10023081_00570 [Arthrobacter ginkgonis]|uniref:Uncharacterized protein n=1 Tax=Arthrobacter ginkgonis TaxID=1630594 RepID=A0ABP7BR35_9MICC
METARAGGAALAGDPLANALGGGSGPHSVVPEAAGLRSAENQWGKNRRAGNQLKWPQRIDGQP